ncbi:MAG TPA: TonB-dependent receptor [Bryobacteraceae bacterium]|nr:TonB-dependent receptor [Bryobacteraceae bacterium]
MYSRLKPLLALMLLVAAGVLSCLPLAAQDARGTITGRVADPTDAVIANAEVRATNVATGVAAVTRTNESGNYVLAYLIPGTYTVEVEIAGFKKFVRQGIGVRVGDNVNVEAKLEVGSQAETVQVTAETPLLETVDASLGQVVDERRIAELPSFGGAPYNLALMAPGTMNNTNLRARYVGTPGAQGDFAVDGAGKSNEFTIDGVPNTMDKGIVFVPPQMSVSEFKVQSVSYDASIGHSAGALVNVSLKSGTNDLHGEVHWFARNKVFDTPSLFQNRAGQKVPPYQDHRYGLSLGGPVRIPKVYNGTNKTFFFYLFEENEIKYNYDYTNTVPTEAMRVGDLSGLLKLGSSYQVYDPFTTTATADGRFQRQPIPGNIIPQSRIDPVAKKMLSFWPLPNQPGNAQFGNNWFASYAGPFPVWTHLGRIDHAFSANHRVYVRAMREGFYSISNKRFLNNYDGMMYNQDKRGLAVDDVYVFNPSFFMNLRYGLTHRWGASYRMSKGFDLSSLGFSNNLVSQVKSKEDAVFPYTVVSPWTALDGNGTDGRWSAIIQSVNANFTKLRGQHSIRFGAEFRNFREFNDIYTGDVTPTLSYGAGYTNGPFNTSPAPTIGGPIAAFLLGIPGGSMSRSGSYAQQENYLGLYIHDDFKVTPKLTVNFGVRYEYETPVTERFNRSVAHFAYDQLSPINAQARANYVNPIAELPLSQFNLRGGLTFAGEGGNGRNLWTSEKNNFMPRVGLAYQLRPKTVLRAGFGLFFDTAGLAVNNAIQTGFSQSTPIQASMDSGLTYVATTANPFPNGLLAPVGSAGGLSTNLGQSLSFFPEKMLSPYMQRWSFGVQQLLPAGFMVDASYVGNRGTRLPVSRNINALPAKYLSTSGVRDEATIKYLAQSFANPLAGTNPIYGTNISRSSLLVPYPQFGSVSVFEPVGYSWYHSMQVRMEKRFSRGYTFNLAYTWAKTMAADSFLNASDPMPYESISTQDRTHRVVLSGIWELPVGRGKHFGSQMPSVLNFVAGGWQLNGMVQRQSGAPLTWGDVWTLFSGDSTKVLLPKSERSVDRWFNTDAGFNKNSGQQLTSNIRVSPLRFSNLRADGQARWDFSIFKNFKMTEKWVTQFRAECINAMNHPNLVAPNLSPTSSAFGTITDQDSTRSWVLSLKVSF